MREVTPAGLELTKRFEGLSLEPYHDPVGYPTIGYGHLLTKEPWAPLERWEPITEDEADALLREDMATHSMAVCRLITVPLSDGQFDALSDFAFNLGAGALQSSTLRAVINRGEYREAPEQFKRWVFAGGRRLRGLERRRAAEVQLWNQ